MNAVDSAFEDVAVRRRFWSCVAITNGCWLWTLHLNRGGYGYFIAKRRKRLAHRIAYELLVGPIPDGLTIDHLCRVRRCVNPLHLEPVTQQENLRRGDNVNRSKTHCPRGHRYTPTNTYWEKTRSGRARRCRTCRRAEWRAAWRKRAA